MCFKRKFNDYRRLFVRSKRTAFEMLRFGRGNIVGVIRYPA
jgi:hypothetical protein